MIKYSLFALALVSLLLVSGCGDVNVGYGTRSSSSSRLAAAEPSSTASQPTQAAAPAQPAQTYQPTRHSTTQPLPPGYGYINEKDLAVATVRQ
ncbi:MAG: hypothetical protein LBV15_05675 [Planctomycetota bacterium]|jgi:hypothetical protein|nr:hypothetical protein [Planctomycetota bacterium]